ncbi:hypothetical protein GCM10009551_048020 [Nocardiopsis tropica]
MAAVRPWKVGSPFLRTRPASVLVSIGWPARRLGQSQCAPGLVAVVGFGRRAGGEGPKQLGERFRDREPGAGGEGDCSRI